MKKENMHKLNLGCSEADHKQPRDRMEDDTDLFIITKKEFRERKSYELPWLQELLLPQKNGVLVFNLCVFKFAYHIY